MSREFDSLLETLAGLAAANIVLIETLHERGVVDKTHFAHAFARALDTLAPEHRGGMIEHVLRNMRDRCMNLPAGRALRRTGVDPAVPGLTMRFTIEPRPGYLRAVLSDQETPGRDARSSWWR